MILADTNVWLALALSRHIFHAAARDWLAAQTAASPVSFCRSTQQSFLRLLTTESVIRPYGISPLTNAAAWELYESLFTDRRIVWTPEPDDKRLRAQWKAFAARKTASAKLWMDSYLAAFAIAGGSRLVTTDRAFAQFKGLNAIILAATPSD